MKGDKDLIVARGSQRRREEETGKLSEDVEAAIDYHHHHPSVHPFFVTAYPALRVAGS